MVLDVSGYHEQTPTYWRCLLIGGRNGQKSEELVPKRALDVNPRSVLADQVHRSKREAMTVQAIQWKAGFGDLQRAGRPRLLVSVRNAQEADTAVRAGAEWIDVKEPLRGPLGCADETIIENVVDAVDSRTPVSAALGELTQNTVERASRIARIPGLALVKIGLAGVLKIPGWEERWFRVIDAVREDAAIAAVAYADWQTASAPPPETVARLARHRCDAFLVDTFDKAGPSLPEWIAPAELERLLAIAHDGGMITVVAGRLTLESSASILPLGPDFIAVRGAVCSHGRNASLSWELVQALTRRLDEFASGWTSQRNT
ncbi:MAG: hypothetical protein JW829_12670 [Pirellulales bacterium]|nr:hypothetical protein [Pirellulales bacterium]